MFSCTLFYCFNLLKLVKNPICQTFNEEQRRHECLRWPSRGLCFISGAAMRISCNSRSTAPNANDGYFNFIVRCRDAKPLH